VAGQPSRSGEVLARASATLGLRAVGALLADKLNPLADVTGSYPQTTDRPHSDRNGWSLPVPSGPSMCVQTCPNVETRWFRYRDFGASQAEHLGGLSGLPQR
jgi:hypothetical protein